MELGCRFGGFFQKIVEPIDRFPVRSRDEVAVGVHGDLDGVVAQLLLDIYGIFPVLKEEVGISYYGRTYAKGIKISWKDDLREIWVILKYR